MSVFRLFILSLLTCFTVSTLSAQSDKEQLANTQLIGRDTSVVIKDSTQKKNVAKKHIPRIATNRSWLIPGWGQAYNKQYWKIPVVYGILAIPSVAFVYNNNMYKKTKFAYEALFKAQLPQPDSTDYRLIDPQLRGLSISSVQSYRNAFRRDRDYSILWFVLAWGLQVADATVFAHLKEFDVSDDLTMQISPTFNPQTRTPGFGLVMSLKNPDNKPRQVRLQLASLKFFSCRFTNKFAAKAHIMNIILVGYGKMGKAIEEIAVKKGHTISLKVDINNADELNATNAAKADVAIEFTGPHSAFDNVMKCLELGLPVVCGSTGWLDRYEEAKQYCEAKNGTLVYASNYSIGVNLFFEVNKQLAKLMSQHPDYNVFMEEIHHTQKKDAPSGTAITLAEQIMASMPQKQKWVNELSTDPSVLSIVSERIDPAPGTHKVKYTSAIDDIEIIHTAHNRAGFAGGAVLAAEYASKHKGIWSMKDVLGL